MSSAFSPAPLLSGDMPRLWQRRKRWEAAQSDRKRRGGMKTQRAGNSQEVLWHTELLGFFTKLDESVWVSTEHTHTHPISQHDMDWVVLRSHQLKQISRKRKKKKKEEISVYIPVESSLDLLMLVASTTTEKWLISPIFMLKKSSGIHSTPKERFSTNKSRCWVSHDEVTTSKTG